jgi:hypothetical protein
MLSVCLAFSWATSHGCGPTRLDRNPHAKNDAARLLRQLVSSEESDRFRVLESAKKRSKSFSPESVENVLTYEGKKNVSTMIFVFMETRNDILYRIGSRERRILEEA